MNPPMTTPMVVRSLKPECYKVFSSSQVTIVPTDLAPPSTSNHVYQVKSEAVKSVGLIQPQVRNIWCSYTLPLHIDLRRVAMDNNNVEINRVSGMLEKRKRNPACFVKISSSGKVNILGCRSEVECKKASRQIARMVQRSMNKLGESIRIRNFKICNIMATCSMPFGIKIEEVARKYSNAHYEPEINTGLLWKSVDPKATLMIHTTGSITVTGATSEANVVRVIEDIYPVVEEFRCELRHRDASQLIVKQEYPRQQAMNRKRPEPASSDYYSNIPKRTRMAAAAPQKNSRTNVLAANKVEFSDEEGLYEEFEEQFFDEDDLL